LIISILALQTDVQSDRNLLPAAVAVAVVLTVVEQAVGHKQ